MDSKPSSASATAAEPPTTYVQADPHTFRDVVQRLTGAPIPSSKPSSPSSSAVGPRRRQAFKLHDRRGSSVRSLEIQLGLTSLKSPRSINTAAPSPVTPLVSDPVFSPPALGIKKGVEEEVVEEEERAIKEKGFYLRPSPRGSGPPELLTLFPLCSPKQQQQQQQEERSASDQ